MSDKMPPVPPDEYPYCPWCGVVRGAVHEYEQHMDANDPRALGEW